MPSLVVLFNCSSPFGIARASALFYGFLDYELNYFFIERRRRCRNANVCFALKLLSQPLHFAFAIAQRSLQLLLAFLLCSPICLAFFQERFKLVGNGGNIFQALGLYVAAAGRPAGMPCSAGPNANTNSSLRQRFRRDKPSLARAERGQILYQLVHQVRRVVGAPVLNGFYVRRPAHPQDHQVVDHIESVFGDRSRPLADDGEPNALTATFFDQRLASNKYFHLIFKAQILRNEVLGLFQEHMPRGFVNQEKMLSKIRYKAHAIRAANSL